jgi:hypothetical protein
MSMKSQGTSLYLIDPSNRELIKVGCATSVTGISGSRDQLEDTCLEDLISRSYKAGLESPGNAQFTINFDVADESHVDLNEIEASGAVAHWAIGWSDGSAPPTVDTNGQFDLPTTRSWLTFDGYISNLPFDFGLNKLVTSQIGVQMTSHRVLVPKA